MKRILNSLVICFLIAPLSFSQDIKLSGQVSVENNQIKNVGDPTDPQDAVTLSYLGLAPTTNEVIILDDFTNRVPTGTSYEDLKYYNKYSDLESTDGTTFEINRLNLTSGISVTDIETLIAMNTAFKHLKIVLEPGGGVALAAAIFRKIDIRGKNVLVIASGGNVDKDIFQNCLSQQEI